MALADLKLPPIKYIRAAKYTEGRTEPVRAFVNHRMVGYLTGTDAYFTNPDRGVSTHFGIGVINGVVEIHQYVPLDDTAYGNGNYDPSGTWDDWGYKTTEVNAQTISIEHEDHNHTDAGKGIVQEKVQEASIKLQALLRYGTLSQWRRAGIIIRDWDRNAPILHREIQAIPVNGRHIITHNDIAGRLKPYCWKPWARDTVGFHRFKYVSGIKLWGTELAKEPIPTPPVTYTQAQLDTAIATAVVNATAGARTKIEELQVAVSSLTGRMAAMKARANDIINS